MRVEVTPLVASSVALITGIAQVLQAQGRIKYDGWPLVRNPSRALRLAAAVGYFVFALGALLVAVA